MILTRDAQLANRIRALRNQGRYPSSDWLQHAEIGYNYRLSELACALGIVQLRRLPEILAKRKEVAKRYDELLAGIGEIERPPLHFPNRTISWFVYVIRLAANFHAETRDSILAALQSNGIRCARYFAPIHQQPAYSNHPNIANTHLPLTESIAQRTIALPFYNRLTTSETEDVVNSLSRAIAQHRL